VIDADSASVVTLRLKPDRRQVATPVPAALERTDRRGKTTRLKMNMAPGTAQKRKSVV
jgi:hypothetical protein